jgi:hypothetical protein
MWVVEMNKRQNDEFGTGTAFEDRMRKMRRWRLVISAGGLVLGVILVAAGNTLVGVIIGGLAIARLVMFTRFSVPARGARAGMTTQDRQWLRAHAGEEFLVAARVLGCQGGELRDQFQQGRSIADVAAQRSIALDQVTTAIADDLAAKARDAEARGTLSAGDAQRIAQLAPRFADRIVRGHRGDFGRGPSM